TASKHDAKTYRMRDSWLRITTPPARMTMSFAKTLWQSYRPVELTRSRLLEMRTKRKPPKDLNFPVLTCPMKNCKSPCCRPNLMSSRVLRAFRSGEHTSELQSRFEIVCRLL